MSDPLDDTVLSRPAVSRADTAKLPRAPLQIEVEFSDAESAAQFLEHAAAVIRESGKITIKVG